MAFVPSSEPLKESLAIESRKTKPSQNKENINMSQLEFQVKRKHMHLVEGYEKGNWGQATFAFGLHLALGKGRGDDRRVRPNLI